MKPQHGMRPRSLSRIVVCRSYFSSPTRKKHAARLHCGGLHFKVRIGENGFCANKREGDKASPMGVLFPIRIFWRRDRHPRPQTRLPCRALAPSDGWCDASGDRNYNRFVRLPYPASCENLLREDHLYDYIIETSWNRQPRLHGRGSAIFIHLIREDAAEKDGRATAGCLALKKRDFLFVLGRLTPKTKMIWQR